MTDNQLKKFLISLGIFFMLFLCGLSLYNLAESWNTPNFKNAVIGSLVLIITFPAAVFLAYLFIRFNPMQSGRIKNEKIRIGILFILGLLTLAGAFHSHRVRTDRRKAYFNEIKMNEVQLRNSGIPGNSSTNQHYAYPPITRTSSWDKAIPTSNIKEE